MELLETLPNGREIYSRPKENIKLESLNSYPSLIDAKRKKLEPTRIHYFDAYERNETQNSLTNNFGIRKYPKLDYRYKSIIVN